MKIIDGKLLAEKIKDEVTKEIARVPYKIVKGDNNTPRVLIDDRKYTPQEISAMILQKMKSLNKDGYPVILAGDFNSTPGSEPINILSAELQDSKSADKSMSMMPDGTFNGFDASKPATERIDFIFTGKGFRATSYGIIRESRDGRYASDHFAVVAEVKFTSTP